MEENDLHLFNFYFLPILYVCAVAIEEWESIYMPSYIYLPVGWEKHFIILGISDISLSGQTLNDNLTGNIATTLSNQPNIGMNSFGVVTSKPVLRGYSGDRFLLIKDGNKTGDLSQSSIDHIITLDMSEVNEVRFT